jgi:hypothetical protein
MKANIHRSLRLLALVILAAGCASKPEKIVFSDESEPISSAGGSTSQPARQALAPADDLKIEQAIYSSLLDHHYWEPASYSAIFLQADDAQVAALIKLYPNHLPPIKPSDQALIQGHQAPLDRDTGKPALVLSTELNEPNSDGSVDALGRWNAGDTVSGFKVFHLNKLADDWHVTDIK